MKIFNVHTKNERILIYGWGSTSFKKLNQSTKVDVEKNQT